MHSSSPSSFGRRTFVKKLSLAGIGLALNSAARAAEIGPQRRRYAIVGTGSRARIYQNAVELDYRDHAELVGLCDSNPGRLELARKHSLKNGAKSPAKYVASEFDRMIAETNPGTVIVTTPDVTHSDYIVRAMELGCDVFTEKPMTTTAERAREIIATQAKTGRSCRVAFNYRYSPPRTQVKDLLVRGTIGDVLSVDFHWLLNTHHGADYFRRWHSQKEISGGLMVHKATHHFDLVNWWLRAMPVSVMATGKREFYTPEMAQRMGLTSAHERCLTCPEKAQCGFYLDLSASPKLKELYLEQEEYDGYFRDRCVWRPEINIEDTMNVLVRYDNDVTLAYSINAFNAWEGYTIAFNGTKGRLEHSVAEKIYVSGTETEQGGIQRGGVKTTIIPLRGAPREIDPWTATGGHGGGDKVLLDDLFLPDSPADQYLRAADQRAGASSILVGVAANRCFETGRTVMINDLLPGLKRPDFAPMPSQTGPVPMPQRT